MFRLPSLRPRFLRPKPSGLAAPLLTPPRTPTPPRSPSRMGLYDSPSRDGTPSPPPPSPDGTRSPPLSPLPASPRLSFPPHAAHTILEDEREAAVERAADDSDDDDGSEWSFGHAPRGEWPSETPDGLLVAPRAWTPSSAESEYEDAAEAPASPPRPAPLSPADVPRRASSLRSPPSPSSARATHRAVVPPRRRGKTGRTHASLLRRLVTRADDAPPVPALLPVRRRSRRKPVPYAPDEAALRPGDRVSWIEALRAVPAAPEDPLARALRSCSEEDGAALSALGQRLGAILAPQRPRQLAEPATPEPETWDVRARLLARASRLAAGEVDTAWPALVAYRTLAAAEAQHAAQVAWFVEERRALSAALERSYAAWEAERDLHLRTLLREVRLRRKVHALQAVGEVLACGGAGGDDERVAAWRDDVNARRRDPVGVPLQTHALAVDRANASIAQLVDWVDRLKVENRGLRARLAGGHDADYNWPSE
ncbi:hypothetical protein Q8F55_007988 [Vanrija albida]|uniref:Uncharacterized protein n=1 Tax=Vanrija albida TaxID=181172 RepID=A0ABR3PVA3_9TREE